MKGIKYIILGLVLLTALKLQSQVWISGGLHYQPATYFPSNNMTYTYDKKLESGVLNRVLREFQIGYKFAYIGYGAYGQAYTLENIGSYTDYELINFLFYERYISFKDFKAGLRYDNSILSCSVYFNYSKYIDNRSSLHILDSYSPPHPFFFFDKGKGYGIGINLGIKLIENLTLGFNGNYVYYKKLLEKKIFRYNPFVEYKYTIKWKN